jgi:hypothetical protein
MRATPAPPDAIRSTRTVKMSRLFSMVMKRTRGRCGATLRVAETDVGALRGRYGGGTPVEGGGRDLGPAVGGDFPRKVLSNSWRINRQLPLP